MALTLGVKRRKAQLWRGEVVGVVCAEVEEDLVLTGGAQGSVREEEKKEKRGTRKAASAGRAVGLYPGFCWTGAVACLREGKMG